MALNFDKPLYSLSTPVENKADQVTWEGESLGGITEDNNRLPVPVVWLLLLTVLTAFAITFPLWGQRPNAGLYVDYVKAMSTPEIIAIQDDKVAMAKIVEITKGEITKHNTRMDYEGLLARHPLSMDDLRIIAPQIQALMTAGKDPEEYSVVGDLVVLANFEGNLKADGKPENRERKQPWWDKGYTIDVFYVIMFFIGVTIVIKCLPPTTWQPKHHH